MTWQSVIGLEVHAQLATKTKIFSRAPNKFGCAPNTNTHTIDLGMPGMLPVLNKQAVIFAIKFALGIKAELGKKSVFARKNYFYPDLPKGYQISQFELPIVGKGELEIRLEDGSTKTIGITRAHLEEDAGKSLHEEFADATGIDLNRAGTPLLEIVSEPDIRSAKEAVIYAKKIHELVQYLEICDGNMQEGSFRVDANVSVNKKGEGFGTRAEIKNINSFKFLEKAINFEIERQIDILESGGTIVQETRLYDAKKDETRSMRTKEEANDYRYFPDPDLLPVIIDDEMINSIVMPELPDEKKNRFVRQYGLSDYDALVLTSSKTLSNYFEAVATICKDNKLAANWVIGDLNGALNKDSLSIEETPISAEILASILVRILDDTISGKIAKKIFEYIWQAGLEGTTLTADSVIEEKGLKQISNSEDLEAIIDEVIANNPSQLAQYRGGMDKLFGFFVGQVMKATKGQAKPDLVNSILRKKLQN